MKLGIISGMCEGNRIEEVYFEVNLKGSGSFSDYTRAGNIHSEGSWAKKVLNRGGLMELSLGNNNANLKILN